MAPEPWIDLSTGISPFAYPVQDLPASSFQRLPEPEQENALRAIAARVFGAPAADTVCLAPGSQMLISLLPLVLRCVRACVLHPGYAEHERSWIRVGVEIARADDADALLSAAGEGTVLVLSNPNNPDGRRFDLKTVSELSRRCEASGGWLVIDEAYADLDPFVPLSAALLHEHTRLVVLRSFGKSFGLAGIRLGFMLAGPAIASEMQALMGPWPVSGPALTLATRALADRHWRDRVAERASAAASELDALLRASGMAIRGGTSLFRLAVAPDAPARWTALAQRGILVRRFEEQPDCLRFGLPPDEPSWRRLREALV